MYALAWIEDYMPLSQVKGAMRMPREEEKLILGDGWPLGVVSESCWSGRRVVHLKL